MATASSRSARIRAKNSDRAVAPDRFAFGRFVLSRLDDRFHGRPPGRGGRTDRLVGRRFGRLGSGRRLPARTGSGGGRVDRLGQIDGVRRLVAARGLPADRFGCGPSLAVNPLELIGHLIERGSHDPIGLEESLPAGPQLLDLRRGNPAAAGQIGEDPLPCRLGRLDDRFALRFDLRPDGLSLLAGRVAHPFGIGQGLLTDPDGRRLGLLGALLGGRLGLGPDGG